MSNYKIVLRGVKDGRSVDRVAASLARFSKKPPEKLRAILLSGKDVVAKRTTEVQQAMRYKRTLEDIGCVCLIQAEITESPMPPSTDAMTASLTNLTDAHPALPVAPRAYEYAKAPLKVRLQSTARVLRSLGLVVFPLLLYYAWLRFH